MTIKIYEPEVIHKDYIIEGNFVYHFIDGCIYKRIKKLHQNYKLKAYIYIKVGYLRENGYYIYGKKLLHRILYEKYYNLTIPKGFIIDHIDRNPENNNIFNLRMCKHHINKLNSCCQNNNYVGEKNIHFSKRDTNYNVQIQSKVIGFNIRKTFKTLKEAVEFRDKSYKLLNTIYKTDLFKI